MRLIRQEPVDQKARASAPSFSDLRLPSDLGLGIIDPGIRKILEKLQRIPTLRSFVEDCNVFLDVCEHEIHRLKAPCPDAAEQLTNLRRLSVERQLQTLLDPRGRRLKLKVLPSYERISNQNNLIHVDDDWKVSVLEDVTARCRSDAIRPEPRSLTARKVLGPVSTGERLLEAVALAKLSAAIYLAKHPGSIQVRLLRRIVRGFLKEYDPEDRELCVLNLLATLRVGRFLRKTKGELPRGKDLLIECYKDGRSPEGEDKNAGEALLRAAYNKALRMSRKDSCGQRAQCFYEATEEAYAAITFLQQGAVCASALLLQTVDDGIGLLELSRERKAGNLARKEKRGLRTLLNYAGEVNKLLAAARDLEQLPSFSAVPKLSQARPSYHIKNMINFFISAVDRIAQGHNCDSSTLLALALAKNVGSALRLHKTDDKSLREQTQRSINAVFGTMAEHLGAQDFRAYLADWLARSVQGKAYQEVEAYLEQAYADPPTLVNYMEGLSKKLQSQLQQRFHVKAQQDYRGLKVMIVSDIREAHRLAQLSREEREWRECDADLFLTWNIKRTASTLVKFRKIQPHWRDEEFPKCPNDKALLEKVIEYTDPERFKSSVLRRLKEVIDDDAQNAQLIAVYTDFRAIFEKINSTELEKSIRSILSLDSQDLQNDYLLLLESFQGPIPRPLLELLKDAIADSLYDPAQNRDYLRFGLVISEDLSGALWSISEEVSAIIDPKHGDFKEERRKSRRSTYRDGKLVWAQSNVGMELPNIRRVTGEIFVQTADSGYCEDGRPGERRDSHHAYKLKILIEGQGDDYRERTDEPFIRSGDLPKDFKTALENMGHSSHVCVSFPWGSPPALVSQLRSIDGSKILSVPLAVPRAAIFADVLAALALQHGRPFSEIASYNFKKKGNRDSRSEYERLLDTVEPGDVFECTPGLDRQQVQPPRLIVPNCKFSPLMALQLKSQCNDTEIANRVKSGKGEVERLFGVAFNAPMVFNFELELRRRWLLIDYGISRFLVNQNGLIEKWNEYEEKIKSCPEEAQMSLKTEFLEVLDERLWPVYLLASNPSSRMAFLKDLVSFKEARYLSLDIKLLENGKCLQIISHQNREGIFVSILKAIECVRGELPNISEVTTEIDSANESTHILYCHFDSALSEYDLSIARQVLIGRGKRNLNASERRVPLSVVLKDQPGAFLEFATRLEEAGFCIYKLKLEGEEGNGRKASLQIIPPVDLEFESKEELTRLIRNALGVGESEKYGNIEVGNIHRMGVKHGSAGTIVKKVP